MADAQRPREPRPRPAWSYGKAYSMGMEFAASFAGFCLVGYLFDRWLDSFPRGIVTGAFLGLIGGTYSLIRQAIRMNLPDGKHEAKRDSRDSNAP